jgi:nitrate reductase NapAB chaperone NapD
LDGAREAKHIASLVVIADEEDRKLVQADLAKGPWFELS